MFSTKSAAIILTAIMLLVSPNSSWAQNSQQGQEFDRIMKMKMAELTTAAEELLEQKYPDEDWDQYNFPAFVYTNDSVEVGYKIAVKEPKLLGMANNDDDAQVIPCYCFCDAMGHKNLLYCFWKDGIHGGAFDDHASECNICYGQAMLAFLWGDLGASHREIIEGMEKKFERLLKSRSEQQ